MPLSRINSQLSLMVSEDVRKSLALSKCKAMQVKLTPEVLEKLLASNGKGLSVEFGENQARHPRN